MCTCYLGNETRLAFKSSLAHQVASQTVSTKQVMGVHICTLCGYWPMADCYYIISSKYDMHKEYVVDAVYMYLSLSTSWGLCCFVIIMVVYWEIHELTLENRRIICTYRAQNMIHCCIKESKLTHCHYVTAGWHYHFHSKVLFVTHCTCTCITPAAYVHTCMFWRAQCTQMYMYMYGQPEVPQWCTCTLYLQVESTNKPLRWKALQIIFDL